MTEEEGGGASRAATRSRHMWAHTCTVTEAWAGAACPCLSVFTVLYEGGSWEAAIFSPGFIIPLSALCVQLQTGAAF